MAEFLRMMHYREYVQQVIKLLPSCRISRRRHIRCIILTANLLAVSVLMSGPVQAQTTHTVFVGGGGSFLDMQDDLASPMRHSGTTAAYCINHEICAPRWIYLTELTFSRQKLNSAITYRYAHYERDTRFGLRAAWGRMFVPDRPGFRVYALIGQRVDFSYRRHRYFLRGYESFVDCLVSLVEVAGRWEVSFGSGRHVMKQELAVPVAGLHLRTPYYGLSTIPSPGIALPDDFIHIIHTAGYRYRITRHWSAEAAYTFSFMRIDEPRRETVVRHRLALLVGYTL